MSSPEPQMMALRFDGTLTLVPDAPLPARAGEALVQVICAGICNTDLEIVNGYAGFKGTLGHEFVGRVVESPYNEFVGRRVVGEINAGCGGCEGCVNGDSRHCRSRTVLGIHGRDGAFAEYLSLPVGNLVEVPDAVSDETAVFVEPLAAALNVLERIDIDGSSNVVLIGDGKLAQLIVVVMASTGCSLTVIGRHAEKLELARRLGANQALMDGAASLRELHSRFDVAIEASGSASGLESAINLVKPRGTIVLKSTHQGLTPLDASQIVVNEISIIGSRCGRFKPAIDLLASGRVDLSAMISGRFPLEKGVYAFEQAADPQSMKVILQIAG